MTKIIKTKSGHKVLVDDEDFEKFGKMKWHILQDRGGELQYAIHSIGARKVYLHRLIFGEIPNGMQIDHINGNGLDNRKENLRICTQSQNSQNQYRRKAYFSSQYKGVCLVKRTNKWRAHIRVENKKLFLGDWDTELQAAQAYDQAARLHFGEFANTNF